MGELGDKFRERIGNATLLAELNDIKEEIEELLKKSTEPKETEDLEDALMMCISKYDEIHQHQRL